MPFEPGNSGIKDVYKSDNVFANKVPVALHLPPNVAGVFIDGIFIPDDPYQPFHAAALLSEAGGNAPHDDPESEVRDYGATNATQDRLNPPEFKTDPELGVSTSATFSGEGTVTTESQLLIPEKEPVEFEGESRDRGAATVCGSYKTNPIDYNQPLSANYTIKSLTIGTVFPHNIVAQNGLTEADIICNLKAVAENILEPLRRQFPGVRVNSGFRKGAGSSQHNKGQAVDVQWPGIKPGEYTARATWIRANLPFDQLIFEHGNSIWLHISFNRASARQRNALLTYYPPVSPQYKPGLTNYYSDRA
jgi:zinc D-Ala-D-Ala carboxypeptidase